MVVSTQMLTRGGTRTEERTQTGDGPVAHIVPPKGGKDGATRTMEARIEGTPVTALCGRAFVPQRDPKPLPVCTGCQAAYEGRFGRDLERDGDTGPVNG